MKRLIIGFGACFLLIAYLFFHIGQLKDELDASRTDVEQLKESSQTTKLSLEAQQEEKALKVSETFLNQYFTFENEPEQKKIEAFLSEKAKEKVLFEGDGEMDFEGSEVTSTIENLKLYRGGSTDNRIQILASFSNVIIANEIPSKSITYATLDLIKEEDTWKIDDLNIAQY